MENTAIQRFTKDEVALIKATVARGTTDTELAYFMSVANTVGLNPFLKEVWCYKDGKGNVIIFTGRDGFLSIAQRDSRWSGITSAYVCNNDEFEIDMTAGKVHHKFKAFDRGEIIGAYAICKPKGCDLPTIEIADSKHYNKGYSVWKTNPGEMIQKVAEAKALKKAYGIAGLQSEHDFVVKGETVENIAEAEVLPTEEELQAAVTEMLNTENDAVTIWKKYRKFQAEPSFIDAKEQRKQLQLPEAREESK
jgi:phage recombination protein Bet